MAQERKLMRRTAEFRKYCPPDFRLDLLSAGLLELFVRSPRNQIHFNGTTNFWEYCDSLYFTLYLPVTIKVTKLNQLKELK